MSHFAANWAIQLRGVDPATKTVAWHLADCLNPAQGCFPTQADLADRCKDCGRVARPLAALGGPFASGRSKRSPDACNSFSAVEYECWNAPNMLSCCAEIRLGPETLVPCAHGGRGGC
jgi:hypothetical protein